MSTNTTKAIKAIKTFKDFCETDLRICEDTLEFNKQNNIPLYENPFRPESEMFFIWWKFVKEELKNNPSLLEEYSYVLLSDIGTKGIFEGKEVFLDLPYIYPEDLDEEVELNIPKRGGSKKYYVYVKNEKGNIIKVSFGQPGMDVKINDKEAREAFAARHDCKNKTDKTKPSYWSCNLPKYAKYLGLEGGGKYYW